MARPAPAQPRQAQRAPVSRRCAEADSGAIQAVEARYFEGAWGMIFGPGLMMTEPLLWCGAPGTPLRFSRGHVAVSVAGGIGRTEDGVFATRAATVEAVHGHAYAELRGERYDLPGQPELWAARAGYLVRPAPSLVGGLLVGVRGARHAPEGWNREAIEVGIPVMATVCRRPRSCWIRWEPVYLITREHLDFSPRLQAELPIGRTPIVAGLLFELKGVHGDDPLIASLSFGIRP